MIKRVTHLHLTRKIWNKWSSALHLKWSEEDLLEATRHLARQSTQRRALQHWRTCILNQTRFLFNSNHHAHDYPNSCLILELVSRCDVVQRRSWTKPEGQSTLPSSSTGEIQKSKNNYRVWSFHVLISGYCCCSVLECRDCLWMSPGTKSGDWTTTRLSNIVSKL